jgi:DNA-binding MarR family transcriptional regulator
MKRNSVGRTLAVLNLKINAYMNSVMKQHNLSSGTMGFLGDLFYKDHICQEELSQIVGCDKGTTARAVSQLEKKGYVKRIPHESHGKKKLVVVTEEAHEIKDKMLDDLKSITGILFTGIDEEEQKMFIRTLSKMNENLIKRINETHE